MSEQVSIQGTSGAEGSAAVDRIRAVARSAGAPMMRIASVEAINQYAPPGARPADILPEVQSVVVVGVESSPGGAWRIPDPRLMGVVGNSRLSQAKEVSFKIAELIETEYGYYALPYGGYALGSGSWDPMLSFKLCAELAGIGTRALAGGMILNPDHGFPYLGVCLTSMPLSPDGPMDHAVCPHPSCVKMWRGYGTTPCITTCPGSLSGSIDDEGKLEYWAYDRYHCSPRANYVRPRLLTMLDQVMSETDPERRRLLLHGPDFSHHLSAVANSLEISGQCFECIRACPVDRARRLRHHAVRGE